MKVGRSYKVVEGAMNDWRDSNTEQQKLKADAVATLPGLVGEVSCFSELGNPQAAMLPSHHPLYPPSVYLPPLAASECVARSK